MVFPGQRRAWKCKVPKLILQPFIENAFFHAFQNKEGGRFQIFAKKQRDDLICEIIDEGDGHVTGGDGGPAEQRQNAI